MNSYLKKLFDTQTSILLNHTLMQLIQFFFNPDITCAYLYHTIVPIKEISKKELGKLGKSIPKSYKYEVFAIKSLENKLSIVLRSAELSDIEVYSFTLPRKQPKMGFIKNIAQLLVINFRPIPTKVDSQFSKIAETYNEYLRCYQIKRSWQNGYMTPYSHTKASPIINSKLINADYQKFLNDLTKLSASYKSLTKILIDIYMHRNEKNYSDSGKSHTLSVIYSQVYGVSLIYEDTIERISYHEVISMEELHPTSDYFAKHQRVLKDVTRCVIASLTKTN